MKKLFLMLLSFTPLLSYALTVEIPPQDGGPDLNVQGSARITGDEDVLFNAIKWVNQYLWFFVGAVLLGLFIYAGYELMTAQGDESKIKLAKNIAIGSGIGLFVAIFAYVIVQLAGNLF